MQKLLELTACETIARVAKGDLTVETLTRTYLDHIAVVEPDIEAWQHLDPDHAIMMAKAIDAAPDVGPLKGMLVGVKDVIDTVDMPTTYGSKAYVGHRPRSDAAVVAQFRKAGALLLGKTVSTEFAAAAPGKTRNPFDLARTPGGSSSGSAAAIGGGMVQVALGTQTAGSTIRPASFCGVVAYKPTYDVIERTGTKPLANSFDTIGVMAKDVRDVALFTSVVGGRPRLTIPDALSTPKVILYRSEAWPVAQPEAEIALQRAIAALSTKGVCVTEKPLVNGFDRLLQTFAMVMEWEVSRALYYEYRFLPDKLHPRSIEMIEACLRTATPERYDDGVKRIAWARANIDLLFGDADVLITPPSPGEAPLGLEKTGDASFNCMWSMLHAPCVTVPAGLGPNNMPIGVQVIGRPGEDARTLSAAAFLEDALKAA
ncbi:amidase [Flavisphingomonas formosensis]|uniref:amidase n=1 Tax=Flavisphingomonas formosensis TaxID=861534 RepID=UPI0012F9B908|nr:amidase [Sphingomonas formosensis]